MDPVAVSAIAAAIGVVAGSVVSTLGIIFRERLVGQQERANQEALRNQVVSDQRDAFQRETIIELQDALARLWAQSADAFNRAERGPLIDDMPGANDLSARINALRSRLFDDELRDLAGQVMIEIWTGVEAADLGRQPAHMAAARTIRADFEARVTVLLNQLF
jgi:hypothetical protein